MEEARKRNEEVSTKHSSNILMMIIVALIVVIGLELTLQSSMNARANWDKKANERTEGMFSIIAAVSELEGKRLSYLTQYIGNMFSFITAVSELRENVRKIMSFPTRY